MIRPYIASFIVAAILGLTACGDNREAKEEAARQQVAEQNRKAAEEKKKQDEIAFWKDIKEKIDVDNAPKPQRLNADLINEPTTVEWKKLTDGSIDFSVPPKQIVITYTDITKSSDAPPGPILIEYLTVGSTYEPLCKDPDIKKIMDKGVPIIQSYKRGDGIEFVRRQITSKDCTKESLLAASAATKDIKDVNERLKQEEAARLRSAELEQQQLALATERRNLEAERLALQTEQSGLAAQINTPPPARHCNRTAAEKRARQRMGLSQNAKRTPSLQYPALYNCRN